MRTYARKNATGRQAARETESRAPGGPTIGELAAGAAPMAAQMGHRVDLPGEIREKMESSFGADFSNVRLFESQTVADAGAKAITRGNSIAFAPGQLDLTSTAGQAELGHELSHVVSQARGESAGRGFLNDSRLEAQADRQGMMAAQGESVFSGPVNPIGASSTAGAAGPMQAIKVDKDIAKATENRKVEFGKGGDLTGMVRDAKARQQDATGMKGAAGAATFFNNVTGNNMDFGAAYRNRWSENDLMQGTAARHLREDDGGLGLTLGGSGGGDKIYSKEEADRRYLEEHPTDIMSGYDQSMLEGLDSVYKLQREWKKRGIK